MSTLLSFLRRSRSYANSDRKQLAMLLPQVNPKPAVNAKAAAGGGATGHAAPIQPGVAIGQKAPQEVNSVTTTPHEHDEDGDENPGAKAMLLQLAVAFLANQIVAQATPTFLTAPLLSLVARLLTEPRKVVA